MLKLILPDGFLFFYFFVTCVLSPNTADTLISIQKDFANYDELNQALEKANLPLNASRHQIVKIEDRMKHLSVMMEYIKTYKELKPIYTKYQQSKDNDSFLRKHESDISIFEATGRQIKELGYSKLPSFQALKSEYNALDSKVAELSLSYEQSKSQVKELSSIKKEHRSVSLERENTNQIKNKKRVGLVVESNSFFTVLLFRLSHFM